MEHKAGKESNEAMSVQETYINTHKIVSLGHSEYLAFPTSIVNMRKGKK